MKKIYKGGDRMRELEKRRGEAEGKRVEEKI